MGRKTLAFASLEGGLSVTRPGGGAWSIGNRLFGKLNSGKLLGLPGERRGAGSTVAVDASGVHRDCPYKPPKGTFPGSGMHAMLGLYLWRLQ